MNMPVRLVYFTRKALGSIRESPWLSLVTSATIGAALLIVGLYALALENIERLALTWGRSASVTAYAAAGTTHADWERIRADVERRPGVARAFVIPPREALERFRRRSPAAATLVEGVDADVLPASVAISLEPSFTDLGALAGLSRDLATIPGVADVDYGEEELEQLSTLLDVLRFAGVLGALLVALATAFIVSNTVKLTVYARRDEVGILGLVGATAWFIRLPFVIEGALWGAAGGGLAVLFLALLDRFAAPSLSRAAAVVLDGVELHLFEGRVAVSLVVAGITLGATASGVAVRRFLAEELR